MANDEKKQKKNKRFFKDFKAELKKVIWPTPKQLVNNTVAVIAIVLILTIIVFFLDVAFEALNTYGIDKIRGAVSTSTTEEAETIVTTETEESKEDSEKDDEEEKTEDKKESEKSDKSDKSKDAKNEE